MSGRLHNALFGVSSKAAKSGIFGTMFLLPGMVKCPVRIKNVLKFCEKLMKSSGCQIGVTCSVRMSRLSDKLRPTSIMVGLTRKMHPM